MRLYTGAEAKALREAATPEPWGRDTATRDATVNGEHVSLDGPLFVFAGEDGDDTIACDVMSEGDADLIVAAHGLAATVEALEAERDALRRQVAELTANGVSIHKAVAAERAATVAWLRTRAGDAQNVRVEGVLHRVAGRIEEGDHHAKESK